MLDYMAFSKCQKYISPNHFFHFVMLLKIILPLNTLYKQETHRHFCINGRKMTLLPRMTVIRNSHHYFLNEKALG